MGMLQGRWGSARLKAPPTGDMLSAPPPQFTHPHTYLPQVQRALEGASSALSSDDALSSAAGFGRSLLLSLHVPLWIINATQLPISLGEKCGESGKGGGAWV